MNDKSRNLNHPRVEALIRELSQLMGPGAKTGMFEKMFTDLALIGRENPDFADHKLIHKTLRELRESLTLFLPFRGKRKVAVFGSSRVSDSHPNYKLAMELAQGLVHQDFQVITGAGGGIMEAANRGAGREKSFGLNIKLPSEQSPNPYIDNDPHLMKFKYFFTRKLMFIKDPLLPSSCQEDLELWTRDSRTSPCFKLGSACPAPLSSWIIKMTITGIVGWTL